LDTLFKRNSEGKNVILPVWHKVTESTVREHVLTLADSLAVDSSKCTLEKLALKLAKLMRAES
jgi:hypothetical protein